MTVIIIFPFHISPSSSSYAPSSSAGIEEEEENFPPPFFSLFGYRSEKVTFPLPFFFAAALLEPQSTSNQSKSIILSAPPLSLLSGKRSHGNQRKAFFFSELFFLFAAFMILRRRNSPAAKAKTLAAPERLSSIRPCLLSLKIQIQNEALFFFHLGESRLPRFFDDALPVYVADLGRALNAQLIGGGQHRLSAYRILSRKKTSSDFPF